MNRGSSQVEADDRKSQKLRTRGTSEGEYSRTTASDHRRPFIEGGNQTRGGLYTRIPVSSYRKVFLRACAIGTKPHRYRHQDGIGHRGFRELSWLWFYAGTSKESPFYKVGHYRAVPTGALVCGKRENAVALSSLP